MDHLVPLSTSVTTISQRVRAAYRLRALGAGPSSFRVSKVFRPTESLGAGREGWLVKPI
jgi:hypothetical protein